jgi:hypothetical protein
VSTYEAEGVDTIQPGGDEWVVLADPPESHLFCLAATA